MTDKPFLILRGGQALVREATERGFAIAEVGDSINIGFPESKTRRGRVGHQVAQTILTGDEQVVVVDARCHQLGTLRGGNGRQPWSRAEGCGIPTESPPLSQQREEDGKR